MIFYLSGTGNTRWVAEQLASGLGEDLVDIGEAFDNAVFDFPLRDDETVGFCFPVQGWRPPMFFFNYICELDFFDEKDKHPYCFMVCTEGDSVGEAIDILADQVYLYKNWKMDAVFDVRMPNTYVGLPFMNVDSKRVAEKKLREAPRRVAYILDKIKKREKIHDVQHKGHWPITNSWLLGPIFQKWLATDKFFRVDTELCTRCGKCASACPIFNIKGGVGEIPQWTHMESCMTCFGCYHSCPQHAIRWGMMTRGKGQYVCPLKKSDMP